MRYIRYQAAWLTPRLGILNLARELGSGRVGSHRGLVSAVCCSAYSSLYSLYVTHHSSHGGARVQRGDRARLPRQAGPAPRPQPALAFGLLPPPRLPLRRNVYVCIGPGGRILDMVMSPCRSGAHGRNSPQAWAEVQVLLTRCHQSCRPCTHGRGGLLSVTEANFADRISRLYAPWAQREP